MAHLEVMVSQERMEHQGIVGNVGIKVKMGTLVLRESQDQKGTMEKMVLGVLREKMVKTAVKETLDRKDHQG